MTSMAEQTGAAPRMSDVKAHLARDLGEALGREFTPV